MDSKKRKGEGASLAERFSKLAKRKWRQMRKLEAVILAVCMAFSLTPGFTWADTRNGEKEVVITEFEPLAENVSIRDISIGTKESDLKLPSRLKAVGYERSDGEIERIPKASNPEADEIPRAITVSDVQWKADREYAGTVSGETFIFTAVLSDRYILEGADLPEITVTISEKSESNSLGHGAGGEVKKATDGEAQQKPFAITKHPHDVYARKGQVVSFSVEATGEDISYQWQEGAPGPGAAETFDRNTASADDFIWSDIADAEEAKYTFEVKKKDLTDHVYRCVLSTIENEMTTNVVKVHKMMMRTSGPMPTLKSTSARNYIFANGAALLLDKGTGKSGDIPYTVVYLDRDENGVRSGGDVIWDPDDSDVKYDGTERGNDLSEFLIFGGSYDLELNGDTQITMTGGEVKNIYGGGRAVMAAASVTGDTTITVKGDARVRGDVYGGGDVDFSQESNVENASVVISGNAYVKNVYGGGIAAPVGGNAVCESTSVRIIDNATVENVYGGGLSSGSSNATVSNSVEVVAGGAVHIGKGGNSGIYINGGTENLENGVESFQIDSRLSGAVYVRLPEGYAASTHPVIAKGAAEEDLAFIRLCGTGAEGLTAYCESDFIKVKPIPVEPTLKEGVIYANGIALILKEGTGENEYGKYTVIYLDKNKNGKIDEDDSIWCPEGDYNRTDEGNSLHFTSIYGGRRDADLTGDTKITMTGGDILFLCGGGHAFSDNCTANVVGDAEIYISGGAVGSVRGGGSGYEANSTANTKNTLVEVTGGQIPSVYGGGASTKGRSDVQGVSRVNISKNAEVGSVYGGGYAPTPESVAVVHGAAFVSITGDKQEGGVSAGSVYLGGNGRGDARIGGSSTLTVGGSVLIGAGNGDGIVINGGIVKKGTTNFAISPALTEDSRISVNLPEGFDASSKPKIAIGAVAGDLKKITLGGDGASGLTAYYENDSIKVKKNGGATETVTGVAVKPNPAVVQRGTVQQFTASVTGAGNPAQTVNWTVEGNLAAETVITGSGLLKVAANEGASSLTVRAVSAADATKSGTSTVTLTDAPVTRYVLTVTGGSGSGSYVEGNQIQITADMPAAGKKFKRWSASGITLDDAGANPITITMPSRNVTIQAEWTSTESGQGVNEGSPNSSGNSESQMTSTPPTTVPAEDGGTVSTNVTTNPASGTVVTTEVKKDASGNVVNASAHVETTRPVITTDETSTTVGIKVDAVAVNTAAQSQGTIGTAVNVEVEIPAETLAGQLNSPDGKLLNIEVEIPTALSGNLSTPVTNIRFAKEAVEAAKAAGKDIIITVKDENGREAYQWTFRGEDLKNSETMAGEINLALRVVPVKQLSGELENIKAAVVSNTGLSDEETPGLSLIFGHSGALPSTAKIRVPSGNDAGIQPGDTVYFYYYNPASGKLEALPENEYTVDSDGYVTIRLAHCSDYVLLPKKAERAATYSGGRKIHIIKKGDTIYKLAKTYGCRVKDIQEANGWPDVYNLQIGRELIIPVNE